jgi:hypothetical protein
MFGIDSIPIEEYQSDMRKTGRTSRGANAIARATTPSKSGFKLVQTNIPRAHAQILEQEAKVFGLRRNQLLRMLLHRKRGLLPFARPATAPTYKFTVKDLRESERYVWSMSPEDKELLDRDCLAMGNLAYGSWIVFALNNWIGRPDGLL